MTETMHVKQGDAADAARAVGSNAKERASDVASTAGDEAKAVALDAKDQAREVVQRSREQLRTEASQQTDRLAATLQDVGEQLRAKSRGEAHPQGTVATLTTQRADTVTNTAGRLRDGGYESAMSDVKRLARNRPGMFLVGALTAGFVVGRVVKAIDTGSLLQAAKSNEDDLALASPGSAARIDGGDLSSFEPARPSSGSYQGQPTSGTYGSSEPASSLPPPPTGTAVPPEVP